MKTAFFLTICVSLFALVSCSQHTHVHGSGKVPPGQAKKMSGSKSAKPYAPGQQKKKH